MSCLRAIVYILRRISVEFQFHLCGKIYMKKSYKETENVKLNPFLLLYSNVALSYILQGIRAVNYTSRNVR
jgi:hypothetical protein